MRNTFLYRLYQADKVLFVAALLYICGILYCVRLSREEFPFLLYGMYSLKETPPDTCVTYSIQVDGKQINNAGLWDARRELMTAPVINFAHVLADSSTINDGGRLEFETWLWNYAINQKKSAKSVLEVYKYTCRYGNAGEPQITRRELLFRYAEQ